MKLSRIPLVSLGLILSLSSAAARAEELHVAVNRLLEPTGAVAQKCSDAEFIRRASLDLTGMLPAVDETRAFLADPAPEKRTKLIDRLLSAPEHARHLATTLDVMLMERRANATIPQDDWTKYLHQSVVANKPFNQLAREILAADGAQPNLRPAVRFYLDRNNAEANLVTRDVGRMFFGQDLGCAQCHDSPLIDDYRQWDYHGLYAYFGGGYLVTRKEGEKKDKPVNYYGEKVASDVHFESVFVKGVKHLTGPRVIDDLEIAEPVALPGDEYQIKPADGELAVPKFSRRAKFAELATNGSNRAFNQNIANRLWATMFGRGLVHPVDLHHSANPPSHPELMRHLGEAIAALKFDMRAFLRELALTDAYQRRLDLPPDLPQSAAAAKQLAVTLEARRAETQTQADASQKTFEAALDEWRKAEAALLPVVAEIDKARAQHTDATGKLAPAQKKVDDGTAALNAKRAQLAVIKDVADVTAAALAKLPNDADLKAANEKLAARTQQVAAEVAPLEKAVADADAVAKPLRDNVLAAQQAFLAATQKTTPFRDAVRKSEETMLARRREAALLATSKSRIEKRIDLLKLFAGLEASHAELAAATQIVQSTLPVLPGEKQKLNDAIVLLTLRQTEHKTSADNKLASEKAATELKTSLVSNQSTHEAIAVALANAQAALTKLPNEAAIADAVAKLKGRSTEYESQVAVLKPKYEAAAVVMTEAVMKEQVALVALTAATDGKAKLEKTVTEMEAALTKAQETAQQKRLTIDDAVTTLTTKWSQDFSVASLKALTPEQLCWSMLRSTGFYDRQRLASAAAIEKKTPLTEAAKQDPVQLAARAQEIEQQTFDALRGNLGVFINIYGSGQGQPQGDFFATADQALFAANAGIVTSWASPAADNVTQKVIAQPDPKLAAEELYLALLVRMPTEQEVQVVAAYLAPRTADRPAAVQELVWGILTSVEFRFGY